MASSRRYTWLAGDDVWFVAARFLTEAGYPNIGTFVDSIRLANQAVIDWANLSAGATIVLPYVSS